MSTDFDSSDPKHPDPQRLRAHVCDALGLPHHASDDEVRTRFESLLEQAVPSTPQKEAIDPKVVKSARAAGVDPIALARGRQIMGLDPMPKRPGIDPALVAEGRRRMGWTK